MKSASDAEVARGPVPELERRGDAPEAHAAANRAMFDRIAPTYDLLNRLMSAGIDRRWRARAMASLTASVGGHAAPRVLDLCAGTLDFAAAIEKALPRAEVTACDASASMLARGEGKVRRTKVVVGDALALPFDDGAFDAVVCGFGVRNLSDLAKGMREVRRVLAPGGAFVTLELFAAERRATRAFHDTFAKVALPALGAAFAGDRAAYAYLAKSMVGFVTRPAYEALLRREGFDDVGSEDLTLGVASVVRGHAGGRARGAA